jgi:uncharacterized membrane protein
MASNVQDMVRDLLIGALEDGIGRLNGGGRHTGSNGGLSGMKGVAVGAGAAALAPAAMKNIAKLAKGLGVDSLGELIESPTAALGEVTSNLGDRVAGPIKDKLGDAVDGAGGPGGILKDTLEGVISGAGGGGGGGGKGDAPGVGKGRRMPVQQSVDIGAPLETVYNQWTQFEAWPNFMHRVTRVTHEDDCTVSFATKIWGKTKEFTAKIETQRPDERIKWKVSRGITHTGVVTFHELGPNLTRVLLGFDVQPGGMLEKAARGMRHIKRAARADLHRFKAFIETAGEETGAWRGVIEHGEVVEEHDPSYDEQREYADLDEILGEQDDDQEGEEGEERGQKSGGAKSTTKRSQRSRQSTGKGGQGGASKRSQSGSRTRSRGSGKAQSSSQSSRRGGGNRSSASSRSSNRSRSRTSSNSRSSSGQRGRTRSGKQS